MAMVRNPTLWWSLVVAWFITLFLLSSMPKLPPGPKIPFEDKIAHTVYYSLGAACVYLARRLGRSPASGRTAVFAAVLFCMAVGAFDEWHQTFVPNRSGNDPFDWLADTLGGFVGSLLGWAALRVVRVRNSGITAR